MIYWIYMNLLTEIRHSQIVPGEPDKNAASFEHRRAARAVVLNPMGGVALLYVGKYGYHKLPGGGVENGEDIAQALERELLEEIGCRATVTRELGRIIEYRDLWNQKQTSECFIAQQVGPVGEPQFTAKELSEGFTVVWASDLRHAISLLAGEQPDHYGAKFIHTRDLYFLRAALGQ
jgi:8-oxo-dGTP pyrophosphatase MutT (NUDIX family)